MARYTDCRKGIHSYSSPGEIGGGIGRRICSDCGLVQIDLSNDAQVGGTDLFTEPKLATMFQVEALLAQVTEEVRQRSFGEAPSTRRRPARAFG
jgi:hypothetical protein